MAADKAIANAITSKATSSLSVLKNLLKTTSYKTTQN